MLTFCPTCGEKLLVSGQRFCAGCGGEFASYLAAGKSAGAGSDIPPPPAASGAAATIAATSIPMAPAAGPRPTMKTTPRPTGSAATGPVAHRPPEIALTAVCAGAALAATVLPWVQTRFFNISASALQSSQLFLVPPIVALVVCWLLLSGPNRSASKGPVYSARISFGVGLALSLLLLAQMSNAKSSLGAFGMSGAVDFAIGFYAYVIATIIGLIASLRIGVEKPAGGLPATGSGATPTSPTPVGFRGGDASAEPTRLCPHCGHEGPVSARICRSCWQDLE